MKEHIDTIPVNDAFSSGDECPFCYLERMAERSTINYVIGPGASYMEPEVREATAVTGFCPEHTKKMYDYGNTLGNALILQSRFGLVIEEFRSRMAEFEVPPKRSLLSGKKPVAENPYWDKMTADVEECFICKRVEYHMQRYYNTFFAMLKEEEFRNMVASSKGFCMKHFARLMQEAACQLPNAHREWFYENVVKTMEENLLRVKEDLDWLIAKFDYRNAGADWKNSKDALSRTMQKLEGIHPADPPYKKD